MMRLPKTRILHSLQKHLGVYMYTDDVKRKPWVSSCQGPGCHFQSTFDQEQYPWFLRGRDTAEKSQQYVENTHGTPRMAIYSYFVASWTVLLCPI